MRARGPELERNSCCVQDILRPLRLAYHRIPSLSLGQLYCLPGVCSNTACSRLHKQIFAPLTKQQTIHKGQNIPPSRLSLYIICLKAMHCSLDSVFQPVATIILLLDQNVWTLHKYVLVGIQKNNSRTYACLELQWFAKHIFH